MPLYLEKKGRIWHIKGTINGERYRKSAKTTSRESAEEKRRKTERDLEDRSFRSDALVFADAVSLYLEKGGEDRFLPPIMDRFQGTKLVDISHVAVSDFAMQRYGHLQPASVKRFLYTPLNAVMRSAHRANLCPLIRFDPPKIPKKAVDYADDQWIDIFLKSAFPRIALTVMFITLTATRVGEACRVTVADVDLARGFAILRMTKSGKSRKVAIPPILVDLLKEWIWEMQLESGDRLFGYADRWSVNQAIKRVCKKAGIRYLSSHKVGRHAFAARLLAEGKGLRTVMEGGGWASIQIVVDTYGHLEQSMVDGAMRESGEAFLGKIGLGSKTLALPPPETTGQENGKAGFLDGGESKKTLKSLVGTTGIEPVTPTMSRMCSEPSKDDGSGNSQAFPDSSVPTHPGTRTDHDGNAS